MSHLTSYASSVQQLIFYHSVLLVYKVLKTKSPISMFSTPYNYKTRQADDVKIRHEPKLKLDLAADGFRWRASGQFNLLPLSIRNIATFTNSKLQQKTGSGRMWTLAESFEYEMKGLNTRLVQST